MHLHCKPDFGFTLQSVQRLGACHEMRRPLPHLTWGRNPSLGFEYEVAGGRQLLQLWATAAATHILPVHPLPPSHIPVSPLYVFCPPQPQASTLSSPHLLTQLALHCSYRTRLGLLQAVVRMVLAHAVARGRGGMKWGMWGIGS